MLGFPECEQQSTATGGTLCAVASFTSLQLQELPEEERSRNCNGTPRVLIAPMHTRCPYRSSSARNDAGAPRTAWSTMAWRNPPGEESNRRRERRTGMGCVALTAVAVGNRR